MADPNFNTSVVIPAYSRNGPTLAIDEAHLNFHTAAGRYKPFADLLRSDGYTVVAATKKFEKDTMSGIDVLVISNAGSPNAAGDISSSAFTDHECDVVRDWVRAGGSLLLIADHAPFGSAAENLGKRFGVTMGKGFVFDRGDSDGSITTTLVFSRENGRLGDHPLLRGRHSSEEVKRIVSFTGQSLSVPDSATALMKLSPTAQEAPTRSDLQAVADGAARSTEAPKGTPSSHASSVAGRAQGIAMPFGKGRLVVLGEAAMFSAQITRFNVGDQQREVKMGMNVPGNDDRQFALNVVHWLSRLLK